MSEIKEFIAELKLISKKVDDTHDDVKHIKEKALPDIRQEMTVYRVKAKERNANLMMMIGAVSSVVLFIAERVFK